MMERDTRGAYHLAVVNSHPIQYFAPLYRRLAAEADLDLTVYYCSRAGVDEYEDEDFGGETFAWDVPLLDGYDHVFLDNLRGKGTPGGFWSLVNPGIVSALRGGDYDAVWLHGHAYATYLLAVLGARIGDSSLLMRCETHLGLERSWGRRLLRRLLMPRFYQLFDAFLAIGTPNARFYLDLGVSEDRIFLMPYAVENERFVAESRLTGRQRIERRRNLGLPTGEVPVVLFVSKLTPRKRPMDLLRAFRRLRSEEVQRVALAFVGAGSERDRLERYVEREKVPDVHFLGFRNQAELPKIYGACDLFVLPSKNEPWGLVVNEAMCAGLPVLVSDEVGAAEDLVQNGQNGFQYPVGDVVRLAKLMRLLVADRELRRRMGRASFEIIEQWDVDACVDGLRRALEMTAGGRNSEVSHGPIFRDRTASRG